jgi:Transglutaminase-like superfamily
VNWQKLRSLRAGDFLLLAEASTLVTIVNVALRLLPYRFLERMNQVRVTATSSGTPAPVVPGKIGWAVQAVARRLPGKNACLVQALTAQAMLRRRGFPSDLRIGVAGRDPDGTIKAHAWVEYDGKVIVGEIADLSSYSVLSSPKAS